MYKPQKKRIMIRARTYSLLTILFSFGLLLLGAGVHLYQGAFASSIDAGHRTLGLVVGILTLFLSIILVKDDHREGESSKLPTTLGFFALILVGTQGLLGSLTRYTNLPNIVNTSHFALSLFFLSLIILIDHRVILARRENEKFAVGPLRKGFHFSDGLGLLFFLSFVQLLLSAYVRHSRLPLENGIENFSHSISLVYWLFGFYWLSKVHQVLKASTKFAQWTLATLALNFLLGVGTFLFPLVKSFQFFSLAFGVLSLAGIWKVNLISREAEKNILGKERYSFWSDLLDLTKPRLGLLVMATVFVGMMLAPRPLSFFKGLYGFGFTFLLVMGAAAFNCWMERDIDGLMDRTKNRPLPTGRLKPEVALIFSSGLMIFALFGLHFFVNELTAILGFLAAALYVFAYTPLKQKSVLALYVGAIPGALPPLMGWTIVMGKMTHMGWVLFWILFVWQLPHFLAISIYHAADYGKADIKVYPNSFGLKLTKWGIFLLTVVLAAVSLYPWIEDQGVSDLFGYFATFLNVVFVLVSVKVFLTPSASENLLRKWARIYFLASIIYLPLLLGSMIYLN